MDKYIVTITECCSCRCLLSEEQSETVAWKSEMVKSRMTWHAALAAVNRPLHFNILLHSSRDSIRRYPRTSVSCYGYLIRENGNICTIINISHSTETVVKIYKKLRGRTNKIIQHHQSEWPRFISTSADFNFTFVYWKSCNASNATVSISFKRNNELLVGTL